MPQHKPVVLVILDGWGETAETRGNAAFAANLPTIDQLDQLYPKITLQASGLAVGLPWLQYGNSEVGHQILGTGQIIYQYLPLISGAIGSGEFMKNQILLQAMQQVKEKQSKLHLLGLISDGGVHSHIDHLFALIELARWQGLTQKTFIHAVTDGRDTPIHEAQYFISRIKAASGGNIATIAGRYYAMDRNNNWDRTQKAYDAMVFGKGIKEKDPLEAVKNQYQRNLSDEHLEPVVITDNNDKPLATIEENDIVIFFNFRKDRARQITRAFTSPQFNKFPKKNHSPMNFVSMVRYSQKFNTPVVFPPQKISCRVSQIISDNQIKQLKIAETEKYAHVTYFFNGGLEKPFPGEKQILIPSKNAPSYANVPEMSAYEITDTVIKELDKDDYGFILVNYANPDMVGHTGDFQAAIKAAQTIDSCLRKLIKVILDKKGCLLITADHGNFEEMINLKTGVIDTQHSNNPVPCWFITPNNLGQKLQDSALQEKPRGMLVDIAPTILYLLGIRKPLTMQGINLIPILQNQQPFIS
ncbi:MAG: 2,3-bisphosphoglycerate-independent phosphoglycerate mutase [Patescibacteria group bacterium]|nr:2,3-bisphosphoglycerate-independent phosphoglycerate mutase [Patescibacteria group bacterium]